MNPRVPAEAQSSDPKLPDDLANVSVWLFGCCSYEETWAPGIEGWGATDKESRASGYVSVGDYDELFALYKKAVVAREVIQHAPRSQEALQRVFDRLCRNMARPVPNSTPLQVACKYCEAVGVAKPASSTMHIPHEEDCPLMICEAELRTSSPSQEEGKSE